MLAIEDFSNTLYSIVADGLNKTISAVILVYSIYLIEKEIRQLKEPGFFAREKVMRLHSTLFIILLVFYLPSTILYEGFLSNLPPDIDDFIDSD